MVIFYDLILIGMCNWNVSLESSQIDSIIFEAKRSVRIYGIGIYGAEDGQKHDYTIIYQWRIQQKPNGKTIRKDKI